jgi:tetratricopeptide (TPR) repeat protein
MKRSASRRAVLLRVLAVGLALCSVSDGRSARIAYAQGATDPTVIKARAAVNRGQYAEAESLLRPDAARAPHGYAAQEHGQHNHKLGRRDVSRRLLQPIANLQVDRRTPAAEYARLGRSARALGQFQLANDAYRLAVETAPKDPAAHTGWGELFLQVHDNAEAMKSFQDALTLDENWIPALLGVAQALSDENPPAATKAVTKALSLDREAVGAHLILARLQLDRNDRETARASIAKAKEINPAGLDALALSAAVAYVEDRRQDFEAEAAAALKINPRFAGAYRVPADVAAANYRFDEAVALNRRALELDENDVHTLSALGMHLLRTGEETEARTVLERAFAIDRFDKTTFNLLTMLDSLDKFDTIRDGDIIVRFDPRETAVMREYVGPLAKRAFDVFTKKYQFTPQGPILIEMFPKHDDFAVRTVGLPGMIGALGACFGRVVTLDSPKARPPGDFNWAPTLWHELAHVMTLQLSKQRVPRWLTEGISVYEEKLGEPGWGREGELSFAAAYGQGEHMSLRELNAGFQDPQKISLAYYQASLLAEHIVNTYGMPALRKLLTTYGEGLEGEAALKAGLGVDMDRLQAEFDKVLATKYGAVVRAIAPPKQLQKGDDVEAVAAANPNNFPALIALGELQWKAGRIDEAFRTLERAAELVPMATGARSPHAMMAQMALQRNDRARAISELEKLLAHAHTDLESARLLAKQLDATGAGAARLMPVFERIAQLDPFDPANHSALGRLKMAAGDAGTAAREFRAAIASGALDPAAAYTDLAESYLALGNKAEARRAALSAIEVAGCYPRAQDVRLLAVGGQ